jgi:hypothetical protein
MSFSAHKFDAILTASQILLVQSSFYSISTLLLVFTSLLLGEPPLASLSSLLDSSQLDSSTSQGWTLAFLDIVVATLVVPGGSLRFLLSHIIICIKISISS